MTNKRSTKIRNIEERGGRGHAGIDSIQRTQRAHNKAMKFNETAPKGVRADSLAVRDLRIKRSKESGEGTHINRRSQENLK